MVERSEMTNLLQRRILEQGLDEARVCWRPLTDARIHDFPRMSLEDLENITVGVYQTRNAPSYAARHFALSNYNVCSKEIDIF